MEKFAFQIAREHCGVSAASPIGIIKAYYACVPGYPYLQKESVPILTSTLPKQNSYY